MSSGSMPAVAAGASPEAITKASKSNLALAFIALPRAVRRDMSVFYSFCRLVDDIADEPGLLPGERIQELERWRRYVVSPQPAEPALAGQVRDVIARHQLDPNHFHEIIFGCEMDVHPPIYETWEDLRLYCHRVASVVGLVSVVIFGARDPQAEVYAKELGLALQMTNIMRDVGEDYRTHGRIYLPRGDMDHFGYDVGSLALGKEDDRWRLMMKYQATRARQLFENAEANLPPSDRRALVAAGIMRRIYRSLLRKMERGGLRTLSTRYRLSRMEKLGCIVSGWLNPG